MSIRSPTAPARPSRNPRAVPIYSTPVGGGALPWWAAIGALVLAWRAGLTLVGLIVWQVLGPAPDGEPLVSTVRLSPNPLLAMWAHWDSDWYIGIAANGYTWEQAAAFFPLYPLAIRAVSTVVADRVLAGLLISHAAVLIAALYLYRLARLDLPEPAARRAVLFLLAFPSSFFLASVYAEALFLALLIPATYLTRCGHWRLGALLGALAALARPVGVLFVLFWAWEYVTAARREPGRSWWGLLWGMLVPAGLAIYAVYTWVRFGDPFLFRNAKAYWGETDFSFLARLPAIAGELAAGALAMPPALLLVGLPAGIATLVLLRSGVRKQRLSLEWLCLLFGLAALPAYLSPRLHAAWAWRTMQVLDYALLVGAWALTPLILARLRPSYGIYCAAVLAATVSTFTLWSVNRYILMLFPVFILLAKWSERSTIIERICLTLALPLLGLLTALFVRGHWVA
jgi:hypothetical protein